MADHCRAWKTTGPQIQLFGEPHTKKKYRRPFELKLKSEVRDRSQTQTYTSNGSHTHTSTLVQGGDLLAQKFGSVCRSSLSPQAVRAARASPSPRPAAHSTRHRSATAARRNADAATRAQRAEVFRWPPRRPDGTSRPPTGWSRTRRWARTPTGCLRPRRRRSRSPPAGRAAAARRPTSAASSASRCSSSATCAARWSCWRRPTAGAARGGAFSS